MSGNYQLTVPANVLRAGGPYTLDVKTLFSMCDRIVSPEGRVLKGRSGGSGDQRTRAFPVEGTVTVIREGGIWNINASCRHGGKVMGICLLVSDLELLSRGLDASARTAVRVALDSSELSCEEEPYNTLRTILGAFA